jgi:hypothetical protein
MATSHLWPRARVCAVLALLSLIVLTGCAPPGSELRRFGVVGTFADDCSKSVAEGGARAIYDVPPTGAATFIAVNRYGTFRSKIVRVDRRGPDTIVMYTDDPGGAWNQIVMTKRDGGFVTTQMVSHKPNDYRPVVAIGSDSPEGTVSPDEGLFVQRCSGGEQALR